MPEGQILINPYAVSPRRAIRLMSDICSARPEANVETLRLSLEEIVGSVFNKEWIAGHASKIGTPLFFKELSKLTAELAFAISYDFFGNYKRVRVTVTGTTSSGKSSLINFLLQRPDLLPVHSKPTTIIPTHIYCNNRKIITRAYAVNHCHALIPVNLKAISGIQHTTDSSNESMGKGLTEQISSALHRFVVECPSEHFNDIEFIDSPGFNATDADNAAALRSLDTSDVILFLIDTTEGHLKKTDIDILQRINKPILLVANCNNKLKSRQHVIDNFREICNGADDFDNIIDCVCLSSKDPDKFGFFCRSGDHSSDVYGCLKKSINTLVSKQRAHTEYDIILNEIKQLFLKEIEFQNSRKRTLESERKTISTSITSQLSEEYNRHKYLPKEVKNTISSLSYSNTVLQEDRFYDRVCYLQNYFIRSEKEKVQRYDKLFDMYTDAINTCSNIINKLNQLYEIIRDWHKARRHSLGIDNTNMILPASNDTLIDPFDVVDDVSDYELEKLIEALSTGDGFDVLKTYNSSGHSLMTYAAYRGNIPALMLIISSLGKSKNRLVRTADREGRNILHCAAEGGNESLFLYIKGLYPFLNE